MLANKMEIRNSILLMLLPLSRNSMQENKTIIFKHDLQDLLPLEYIPSV